MGPCKHVAMPPIPEEMGDILTNGASIKLSSKIFHVDSVVLLVTFK